MLKFSTNRFVDLQSFIVEIFGVQIRAHRSLKPLNKTLQRKIWYWIFEPWQKTSWSNGEYFAKTTGLVFYFWKSGKTTFYTPVLLFTNIKSNTKFKLHENNKMWTKAFFLSHSYSNLERNSAVSYSRGGLKTYIHTLK